MEVVDEAAGPYLERRDVFDVFSGPPLGELSTNLGMEEMRTNRGLEDRRVHLDGSRLLVLHVDDVERGHSLFLLNEPWAGRPRA